MDGGTRLPKKPKFWLGIGGSFNPIHIGHIRVLELAKQHLEEEFGQGCVLGGVFLLEASVFSVVYMGQKAFWLLPRRDGWLESSVRTMP